MFNPKVVRGSTWAAHTLGKLKESQKAKQAKAPSPKCALQQALSSWTGLCCPSWPLAVFIAIRSAPWHSSCKHTLGKVKESQKAKQAKAPSPKCALHKALQGLCCSSSCHWRLAEFLATSS